MTRIRICAAKPLPRKGFPALRPARALDGQCAESARRRDEGTAKARRNRYRAKAQSLSSFHNGRSAASRFFMNKARRRRNAPGTKWK